MVDYTFECGDDFQTTYNRLDNSLKIKVKKQILKIIDNPTCGKPMRNVRKGTREVRVKPYRLSYYYDVEHNHIIFLDFYHKDKQ
jgi:mRNA-degrading endonuclease RelE of RelBE toxin-antitoxin system